MNRALPKAEEVLKDIGRIGTVLIKESERGCVLVAAAFIDDLLEVLLRTHFRRDGKSKDRIFMGHGPLSTFSSRLEIAYQLELIDATQRSALNMLRKIRNDYAHLHASIEFDSDQMKAFCAGADARISDATWEPLWVVLSIEETPKVKFVDRVIALSAVLAAAIQAADERLMDAIRLSNQKEKAAKRKVESYKQQLEKSERSSPSS